MSRSSPSSAVSLFLSLCSLSVPALAGEARLKVSGSLVAEPGGLEARLEVRNDGDQPAAPLAIEGELLGKPDSVQLAAGVDPGAAERFALRFPLEQPRVGTYALMLRLDYPNTSAGVATSRWEYAYLTLGAPVSPAVSLRASEVSLDTTADLTVDLASSDGSPHQVQLSVFAPPGLRADAPPDAVSVPGSGQTTVNVRLFRCSIPRGSRQRILVLARPIDGRTERSTVGSSVVQILSNPALLPRFRPWLFALSLLLLLTAVGAEIRAVWRRR